MTVPTIVLEDISSAVGHPAVGITVRSASGASVKRIANGVQGRVRTAGQLDGDEYVEDHEVPVGVEVVYTVNSDEGSASARITIRTPSAWLSDPLDWTSGIELDADGSHARTRALPLLAYGSLISATRPMSGTLVLPLGSTYPVALGQNRQSSADLSVVITAWTKEQANAVTTLLASAGIILLRIPAEAVEKNLYLFAENADIHHNPISGITRISLKGQSVSPPSTPIQIVRWSYETVLAATGSATYSALLSAQAGATYIDLKKAPLLGG